MSPPASPIFTWSAKISTRTPFASALPMFWAWTDSCTGCPAAGAGGFRRTSAAVRTSRGREKEARPMSEATPRRAIASFEPTSIGF